MSSTTWLDQARAIWSAPGVKFTTPPASFFKFPPDPLPATLPPPPRDPTIAHPFTISEYWYNALLSPNVPITFALVYATTITYLNAVNKRRNYKPWAISQTYLFTFFVLLHNLFLSAYSAWTFLGMLRALNATGELPGREKYGLALMADSLCKMHGPRGVSSAAIYSPKTSQWAMTNRVYHLAKDTFLPETTDVGRMWNEGLAFYGWIFYISKFYEVVDTLIIIAKGKKSSFLQTYHHAGAMMCMWAGMRYMSPPIWLFVFLNSFIHAVMYLFYFFTALRIKVPKPLKQLLTTLQITQFVVGMTYAFSHYFVAYRLPVSTPYVYHFGEKLATGASALAADAASEFSSAMAAATATAGSGQWLKKIALRAAGREGLAENVQNELGQTFGIDAVHAVTDFVGREEIRYKDELTWTHCLDTSGQSFAIYLNLFYLLPLTWLFLQFFVNSYIRRIEARKRRSFSDKAYTVSQSIGDARRGVGRRLSQAFEDSQGWNGEIDGEPVVIDRDQIRRELRELAGRGGDQVDVVQKYGREAAETVSENVNIGNTEQGLGNLREAMSKKWGQFQETAVETPGAGDFMETLDRSTNVTRQEASNTASKVMETMESYVSEDVRSSVTETVSYVTEKSSEIVSEAAQKLENFKESMQSNFEQITESVQTTFEPVVTTSSELKEKTMEAAPLSVEEIQETAQGIQASTAEAGKEAKEEAAHVKDDVVAGVPNDAEATEETIQNLRDSTMSKAEETSQILDQKKDDIVQKAYEVKEQAANSIGADSDAREAVSQVKQDDRSGESDSRLDTHSTVTSTTVVESPSVPKVEQDRVIEESKLVRDDIESKAGAGEGSKMTSETLGDGPTDKSGAGTLSESKHEDLSESFVKDDISYAEAVKEASEESISTSEAPAKPQATQAVAPEAEPKETPESKDEELAQEKEAIMSRISVGSRTMSDPAITSTVVHSSPPRSVNSSRYLDVQLEFSQPESQITSPDMSFYSAQTGDASNDFSFRAHRASYQPPRTNLYSAVVRPSMTVLEGAQDSAASDAQRSKSDFWGHPPSSSAVESITSQHTGSDLVQQFYHRRDTPPSPTPTPRGGGFVRPVELAVDSESEPDLAERSFNQIQSSAPHLSQSSPPSDASHEEGKADSFDRPAQTRSPTSRPNPRAQTPTTPGRSPAYFSFDSISRPGTGSTVDSERASETGSAVDSPEQTTLGDPSASSQGRKWHSRRRGGKSPDALGETQEPDAGSSMGMPRDHD